MKKATIILALLIFSSLLVIETNVLLQKTTTNTNANNHGYKAFSNNFFGNKIFTKHKAHMLHIAGSATLTADFLYKLEKTKSNTLTDSISDYWDIPLPYYTSGTLSLDIIANSTLRISGTETSSTLAYAYVLEDERTTYVSSGQTISASFTYTYSYKISQIVVWLWGYVIDETTARKYYKIDATWRLKDDGVQIASGTILKAVSSSPTPTQVVLNVGGKTANGRLTLEITPNTGAYVYWYGESDSNDGLDKVSVSAGGTTYGIDTSIVIICYTYYQKSLTLDDGFSFDEVKLPISLPSYATLRATSATITFDISGNTATVSTSNSYTATFDSATTPATITFTVSKVTVSLSDSGHDDGELFSIVEITEAGGFPELTFKQNADDMKTVTFKGTTLTYDATSTSWKGTLNIAASAVSGTLTIDPGPNPSSTLSVTIDYTANILADGKTTLTITATYTATPGSSTTWTIDTDTITRGVWSWGDLVQLRVYTPVQHTINSVTTSQEKDITSYSSATADTIYVYLRSAMNAGLWDGSDITVTIKTTQPQIITTLSTDRTYYKPTDTISISISTSVAGDITCYANTTNLGTKTNTNTATYTTTLTTEGKYIIKAVYSSLNYNKLGYSEKTTTIYIDATPPNFTSWSPENSSYHNTTDITVTWNAADNYGIDHYEVALDQTTTWTNKGTTTSHTFNNLTEGEHNIHIKAVDLAGNEEIITLKIIVDTTPPSITITDPADGSYISSNTITVTWSYTEAHLQEFEIYVDGSYKDSTTSTSYTLTLSEGQHTVKVVAIDKAGNTGSDEITVYIDVTDPSASFDSYPQNYTDNLWVTISFGDMYLDHAALIYDVGFGNATYKTWTTSQSGLYLDLNSIVSADYQGPVTLYLDVYDKAGHYVSIKLLIYVDKYLGGITASVPNGWVSGTQTISASWNTDEKYPEAMYLYIDNVLLQQGTEINYNWDTTTYTDGEHTISIKYVDKAGHYAWSNTTVYVDNTQVEIIFDTTTVYQNATTIAVEFSVKSNGSTITWEIYVNSTKEANGTATADGTWKTITTQLQHTQGTYIIYIKYWDQTHPAQTTQTKKIIIDTTKPTLGAAYWTHGIWGPNNATSTTWTQLLYGDWVTDSEHQGVTIRIELTDNYGIDTITITLNSLSQGDVSEKIVGYTYDQESGYLYVWIETQLLRDGDTLTLSITAQDPAGNSNSKDYVFKLDNALPQFNTYEVLNYGYTQSGVYYYGGNYSIIVLHAIISDSASNLWNISVYLDVQEIIFAYWDTNTNSWMYTIYNNTIITQVSISGDRSSVELYVYIDATKLSDGQHNLKTTARDDAGYVNSNSINIAIDWTPPTIIDFWGEPYGPEKGTWANFSVIEGQWYIYYKVEDYATVKINLYVNTSDGWYYFENVSIGNGTIWDTTDPDFRNGIFKLELVANDALGNMAKWIYIIAAENNENYPELYINGTRVIDSIDCGGSLKVLVAIDVGGNARIPQGWPTGLKQYIVYLDGVVLYNVSFDGWRGYYGEWYNFTFILNETHLTPGTHTIRIWTKGMSYWSEFYVDYTINYKPRVKIELLNTSVYWGNIDLYFNVTDIVGRPLDGRLNVSLNSELYSLSVTDGSAVLSYVYLTPGTYSLDVAYYQGDGLDTNASFSLEVLRHPLTYSYALSAFAVNRSYSINLTNILDALDNMQPTGVLWFEIYWSYTSSGPWFLLHNVSYEGSAILISGAWTTNDLNGDGVIDSADDTLYVRIVVGGYYSADDVVVQRSLLRGSYTISLAETEFYWGAITLQITVDDTTGIDEDGYVVVSLLNSEYTVDVTAGQGTLSVYLGEPGNYTLTITYVGQVINTTETFTITIMPHDLGFSVGVSKLAVNRTYTVSISGITDAVLNKLPDRALWFEIYYATSQYGPWILLHNTTYEGADISIEDAWTIDPGVDTIHIKVVAGGYYKGEKTLTKTLYRGSYNISLSGTEFYWGDITLTIIVDDSVDLDENGYVVVSLLNSEYTVDVTAGQGTLSVYLGEPGNYTLTITYVGQVINTTETFTITIMPHDLSFNADTTKLAVNRSYVLSITDIVDSILSVLPDRALWFEIYYSTSQYGPWTLLHNVTYSGSDITINGAWIIDPGADTIYIKIVAGGYYEGETVLTKTLYRGSYNISLSGTEFYWGDITLQITVDDTVNLDEDNYVLVNLAGTVYTVDIAGGQGTLSMHIDTPGSYTLTVTYVGDVVNATRIFTLEVLKHPVSFDIDYPSALYVGGYYELQLYDIIDTAIGNVPSDTFTVNITYTWELPAPRWFILDYATISGSAYSYSGTWSISDINGDGLINAADYYVYIRFTVIGNKYEGEKVIGPITVKQVPEISMTQQSDTLVYTDYGEFLVDTNVPNAFIQVYYWDNMLGWVYNGTWMTDSQGNAIVNVYVPDVGTVKYLIVLNETEHYQEGEAEFEFNAVAESTEIHILSVGTWRYSDQAVVTVYLEDDDGVPSRNVEIELRIYESGSWITVGQATTNATGYATVITTCWLGEGTYNLTVLIIDDRYVGEAESTMISVLKEKVTKIDAKVESGTLIVSVIDDENESLPGIPIEIVYNGSVIGDSITGPDGKAVFNIAGYEGKELIVRIKDNKYAETKETKVTIPQNYVSTLNANRWIVVVFALAIAGIAIAYYYRREEGYRFDENIAFGAEGGAITLERRSNNITPQINEAQISDATLITDTADISEKLRRYGIKSITWMRIDPSYGPIPQFTIGDREFAERVLSDPETQSNIFILDDGAEITLNGSKVVVHKVSGGERGLAGILVFETSENYNKAFIQYIASSLNGEITEESLRQIISRI